MAPPVSPLAPETFAHLPPLAGVRLATHASGLRYKGRTDLLLAEMAPGTTMAGVYTRSLASSAPVDWCRKAGIKGKGKAQALVVNSGNANAFTGRAGDEAVAATVKATAQLIGCKETEVFVSSTGTIGVPLPHEKITAALPKAVISLKADAWLEAAKAIMTTDTYPKLASRHVRIGDVPVTINGIAKGSGMIAPDMATMLAYVFTDAALPAPVLQKLLTRGCEKSFNAITVDSDTSTSDTLLLFATGQARHKRISDASDPALKAFREGLDAVMLELAHLVVKDGEGASKFVEITVSGAASSKAAKRIAFSIANSPLMKTAIAGEDANWGRVVMAVGKAGEKADRDRLMIRIGGFDVACNGAAVPGYDETPVANHMKGQNIKIEVDVGVGNGRFTAWTCDLTHGYIDINGSYRT
ncbi:MAG: bifunctional glutamate N-acetyltransferase/amino-acid acetyltransferase ArgJ [Rhodospirillales bacterium]|nr:MAG: bifunctional glutamate N-acetyltransferase/amino-acid acetyltransferase ArgJ [Rhodospirillales bacterium]